MKNAVVLLVLLTCSHIGQAQEWKRNLNEAMKEASGSGKNVLLFFSVSADCNSCEKLNQKVLQSQEFMDYAKDNFILVKQDFHNDKPEDLEENLLIVEKYNKDGFFPLVVILNKNAKIAGQIGAYNDETPQQYVAKLQSIKRS